MRVPTEPTKAEFALHCRSVAKLRIQLFRRFKPSDYRMIEGSETILPMHVWQLTPPPHDKVIRYKSLGGLGYDIESPQPGEFTTLKVAHKQDDIFQIAVGMGRRRDQYTRFIFDTKFSEVDTKIKQALDEHYRSQAPIPPLKPGRVTPIKSAPTGR